MRDTHWIIFEFIKVMSAMGRDNSSLGTSFISIDYVDRYEFDDLN